MAGTYEDHVAAYGSGPVIPLAKEQERPNNFFFDPTVHKSYATRENLERAIAKLGFTSIRHMIFQTADGRWAAVFTGHEANPVIFHGFVWFM